MGSAGPLAAILGPLALAIIGSIAAWRKLGPERQQIIVKSAESLVIVQDKVIENLREEMSHLRTDMGTLRQDFDTVYGDLKRVRRERDELRKENETLRERVEQLEQRVRDLERHELKGTP